jgi:hypothetical protein
MGIEYNAKKWLDMFPKKRQELPEVYKLIYEEHRINNREGRTNVSSLSMKMEKWLHRIVASDVKNKKDNISTLEIGAGILNQLPYEPNIVDYDIIEPFDHFYKNSKFLSRIKNIYSDIREIKSDKKYMRITSVATFEHIVNLPEVVAMAVLLLDEKGSLRVSIPNEGTILWRFGTMITGIEFKKKYNLNYKTIMKYEHVNSANEIENVLKYFFKKTTIKVLGINRSFAFYRFISCKEPDISKARNYILKQRHL